jgi:uncharacterized DUF497 family protein
MSFDPEKDRKNRAKHGVSLARWSEMEMIAVIVDDRFNYGEERYRAFGRIEGFAYCLTFTVRDGNVRPISLRRAHGKEIRAYEKTR